MALLSVFFYELPDLMLPYNIDLRFLKVKVYIDVNFVDLLIIQKRWNYKQLSNKFQFYLIT